MNFKRLEEYLDRLNRRDNIDGGTAPGSNTVIYMNHKRVFSYSTGYDDIEAGTRTSPDKMYNLYSCSKITTAVAAMQLIERGLISVYDPVAKYIPAFANVKVGVWEDGRLVGTRAPKTTMLIRHLLTMTSGMTYNIHSDAIERVIRETDGRAPTLLVCDAMAEEPLIFDPGERYQYSESLDVMGGVIEVATGMKFSEYVQQNIFDPLGMTETTYHPDYTKPERHSTQYGYDPKTKKITKNELTYNPHRLGTEYDGGGAGISSTTNDYVLLLDALANGGVGANGARILTEAAIDVMRTPMVDSPQFLEPINRCCLGYNYCYGVRVCVGRGISANLAPIGEFGWDGWKMCLAMIDPENRLAVFHTEHLGGFHSEIIPKLRNIVYYCLGQ